MAVNNKRNLIVIASLFVAILSACIIISIKENNALVSSSSGNVLSSVTSQLPSSAVLSSANITSSSSSAASSLNNTYVEIFLKEIQANSSKFQFFDFAMSTVNFSDDTSQIEAVVSYYRDKQSPDPTILIITNHDTHEYDLAGLEKRVFADNGKITITGKNDLTVAIQNVKTKEIYDCKINYTSTDQVRGSRLRNEPVKRESK